MRGTVSFFKKELLELARTGRLLFLLLLTVLFGIMNPAIAKLTPWLYKMAAETLEGQGLTVGEVNITAMDSWTQFVKNIPMLLIAVLLIFSGIFTTEYSKGMLVPILTKGISRTGVVIAKTAVLFLLWSVSCLGCAGITCLYSAYYWDNPVVNHIAWIVFGWWLLGMLLLCAVVFFSSFAHSSAQVLLGVGGFYGLLLVLSLFGRLRKYLPIFLSDSAALMTAQSKPGDYYAAIAVTIALGAVMLLAALPITKRRQL